MYSDTAPVFSTHILVYFSFFSLCLKRSFSVLKTVSSEKCSAGLLLWKRESITHKAPLSLSVVIVLRDDRLLFQASIKAMLLFHMSAGRANPALLAPPAAFYEERTGSQQASSLSSINEEEEEEEEVGASSVWKSSLDFHSKEYWFIGPKQSLF